MRTRNAWNLDQPSYPEMVAPQHAQPYTPYVSATTPPPAPIPAEVSPTPRPMASAGRRLGVCALVLAALTAGPVALSQAQAMTSVPESAAIEREDDRDGNPITRLVHHVQVQVANSLD